MLADYAGRHPGAQPVLVGDLSRPRGGDFGPRFGGIGHASHQNGLDADVYYPRLDGRLRRARRPDQVDRAAAQELVDAFVREGAEYVFVGPSLDLRGPTQGRAAARQPRRPPARAAQGVGGRLRQPPVELLAHVLLDAVEVALQLALDPPDLAVELIVDLAAGGEQHQRRAAEHDRREHGEHRARSAAARERRNERPQYGHRRPSSKEMRAQCGHTRSTAAHPRARAYRRRSRPGYCQTARSYLRR